MHTKDIVFGAAQRFVEQQTVAANRSGLGGSSIDYKLKSTICYRLRRKVKQGRVNCRKITGRRLQQRTHAVKTSTSPSTP